MSIGCEGVGAPDVTRDHETRIFVFGSNKAGRHSEGAAKFALEPTRRGLRAGSWASRPILRHPNVLGSERAE